MDREAVGPLDRFGAFLARRGRRAWPLTVTAVEPLTPGMVRVRFAGPDLHELEWKRGQDLLLELPMADGGVARRHYTIRHHDAAARTLSIDFVRHGQGGAMAWLDGLKPGHRIDAVGPRGHTWLRDGDWHLFVGDETCIPAIFAMLESVPEGETAHVFLEAAVESERLAPDCAREFDLRWHVRNGAPPGPSRILYDAVEAFALPAGEGHAYVIGETSNVRAIRHRLIARGMERGRIVSEGYWRPGRIGGHDHV